MVSGIPLKVSLARRQPQIEPINDATSSAAWATLGKYYLFSLSYYIKISSFMMKCIISLFSRINATIK